MFTIRWSRVVVADERVGYLDLSVASGTWKARPSPSFACSGVRLSAAFLPETGTRVRWGFGRIARLKQQHNNQRCVMCDAIVYVRMRAACLCRKVSVE